LLQRHHRVDSGGSPGGKQAGRKGDHQHDDDGDSVRHRIVGGDPEQQIVEQPQRPDRGADAGRDSERGDGSFAITIEGAGWLAANGFNLVVAGRTCWGEEETAERAGYRRLFESAGLPVDADDPQALVLFPEMDGSMDVPEITVDCWGILDVDPGAMMCATSRMVVKRKGEGKPTVLPCTLLPYSPAYGMGSTLKEAAHSNGGMFERGAVKLCHPHCAKFCVLGGGNCSG